MAFNEVKTIRKIGKEVLHTRDMIAKHSVKVTDQITKSLDDFLFSITKIWKDSLEPVKFEQEAKLEYESRQQTKSGVEVKSKGEKMIADLLTKKKIKFDYEKKFFYGDDVYVIPDFYLPEHDMWIEYWGLANVDDKEVARRYEAKKKWKEGLYRRFDLKWIYLFPSQVESPKFEETFDYKLGYVIDR